MNKSTEEDREFARYEGGLEERLDFTAWTVLVLGLLFGFLVLMDSPLFSKLVPAIAIVANAWICWLILHGLAEVVRLQKRANDLPYSGQISQAKEVAESKESLVRRCESCGKVLDGEMSCDTCRQWAANADQDESGKGRD